MGARQSLLKRIANIGLERFNRLKLSLSQMQCGGAEINDALIACVRQFITNFGTGLRSGQDSYPSSDRGTLEYLSNLARIFGRSLVQTFGPKIERVLLRAAPALYPERLHDLNYAERRGALYLLCVANLASPCSDSGECGASSGATSATATAYGLPAIEHEDDDDVQATRIEAIQAHCSVDRRVWLLLQKQGGSFLHHMVVSYL
jgi:hypothetical protein